MKDSYDIEQMITKEVLTNCRIGLKLLFEEGKELEYVLVSTVSNKITKIYSICDYLDFIESTNEVHLVLSKKLVFASRILLVCKDFKYTIDKGKHIKKEKTITINKSQSINCDLNLN